MCLRQEKSLGSWQITNLTTAKHHDLLCKITTLNIFNYYESKANFARISN